MKSKYTLSLFVTAVVLILDQATKLYIDRTMEMYSSIVVVKDFFAITNIRNKGAAFSFLANSPYRLPILTLVSVIAIIAIIVFFRKLRPDQKLTAFSLALIFAGAVGNLIDRVRLGEVIDFLVVHWHEHYWPAFNVADSAICVGVFLLAIDMYVEEKRLKRVKN
ncbi:MAG: lspA [Geobacteraceae bacterium]|nr:lspA [Geobacteraceae bacterium]